MSAQQIQVDTTPRTVARARFSLRALGLAVLLALILAAALGLRMYGMRWSLPYTDHPDEPSAVNRVFGMLRRDDWNPRFFGKPSLYYYALRLVFDAHLRYGVATGLYEGVSSLPETTDRYVTTPEFFVWGRLLTVLLGTASVGALYLLGRRWWGAGVGLVAAALLAVAPFHVRNSQYITQDVPMTLMALVALLASLAPLRSPGWRNYALAGFCIGLATSTKYNVALVAVALVVVHLQAWGRRALLQIGRLALAAVMTGVAFALTTPYSVLEPVTFWGGMLGQYTAYNPGGDGMLSRITAWRVADYMLFFWQTGLYPLPSLMALLGIGVVIARRDRAGIALLAFVAVYLIAFMAQEAQFDRNLLPVMPVLFLLSGIGVETLARLVARAPKLAGDAARGWLPPALATALTLALLVAPSQRAVAQDQFYAQTYSKIRVTAHVRDQLPQGAPMALALRADLWAGRPFVTTPRDVTEHDLAWYRAHGFRYVVANVDDANPERYAALRTGAAAVQEFPGGRTAPGPQMELLDLGLHPDQLAIERRDVEFGGQLRLLGFQRGTGELRSIYTPLDGTTLQAGQALQLNLFWQPIVQLPHDYAIFLHLLDAQGQKVAQRDTLIRGADYPTSRWVPGELAIDLADLPLPADLPPGSYRLVLGVYDMERGERLSVPGSPENSVVLLTVELAGP